MGKEQGINPQRSEIRQELYLRFGIEAGGVKPFRDNLKPQPRAFELLHIPVGPQNQIAPELLVILEQIVTPAGYVYGVNLEGDKAEHITHLRDGETSPSNPKRAIELAVWEAESNYDFPVSFKEAEIICYPASWGNDFDPQED